MRARWARNRVKPANRDSIRYNASTLNTKSPKRCVRAAVSRIAIGIIIFNQYGFI